MKPKRAIKGQPLAISAAVYNRMVDIYNGVNKLDAPNKRGTTIVITAADESIDVGQMVCVTSVLKPHSADGSANDNRFDAWFTDRLFDVVEADDATLNTCVAVATETIDTGTSGRALISGLAPVYVRIVDDSHNYVDYSTEVNDATTTANGRFKIIWRETRAEIETRTWLETPNGDEYYGWMLVDLNGVLERGRFAEIVAAGPEEEEEPTDASYWVSLVVDDGLGVTNELLEVDDETRPEDEEDASSPPLIVLATNLMELAEQTHSLPVGTIVEIFASDVGGRRKFYFQG